MYLVGVNFRNFDATETILESLRSGDADINDTDTKHGKQAATGSSIDTSIYCR